MEEEWLSRAVAHLWPYFAAFAETSAREILEPMIQAALPRGLRAFYFETVDLSHCKPLQLSNVVSIPESGAAPGATRGDHLLKLRCDIDLDMRDPKIIMKFKHLPGLQVAVSSVRLKGRVALVLRPLVAEIPFFGAGQAYFPDHPTVRLEFKGAGKMASLPVVRRVVQNVVDQTIGDMLVLPNTFVVKIHQYDGLFEQLYVWPMGVARVRLVEARDLLNLDTFSIASDPYAVIQLGPDSFITSVVKNSLNPKWTRDDSSASHDFIVSSSKQLVTLRLYDRDRGHVDDCLGAVSIPLADLIKSNSLWLPLKGGGQGKVHLEGSLLRAGPIGQTRLGDMYLLTILIDRAANLPSGTRKLAPQVRVDVAGHDLRSFPVIPGKSKDGRVIVDVLNPQWEQAFNILLTQSEFDDPSLMIKLQVYSHMEVFGFVQVPLARVISNPLLPISAHDLTRPHGQSSPMDTQLYFGAAVQVLQTSDDRTEDPLVDDEAQGMIPASNTSKDWIQDIMDRLWPKAAVYAEMSFRAVVEPVLGAIQQYTHMNLGLESVDFGSTCPLKLASLNFVEEDNRILVYMDIVLDAPVDVRFAFRRASAGLARLSLVGSLRVVFTPLCNQPPFFEAIMVSFTRPPLIDLEFSGISSILNAGGRGFFNKTVLGMVDKRLRAAMVLPSQVSIDVDTIFTPSSAMFRRPERTETVPLLSRTYKPLDGVLRVRVVAVEESTSSVGGLRSNVFVELTCGSYSRQTSERKACQHVIWPPNEVFHFPIADFDRQLLLVRLKQRGWFLQTKLVGEAAVHDLLGACNTKPHVVSIDRAGGRKIILELSLFYHHDSRTFTDQGPPELTMSSCPVRLPRMLVTMQIHHAVGLPDQVLGTRVFPFVSVAMEPGCHPASPQMTPPYFPLSVDQKAKLKIQGHEVDKPTWNCTLHWVILERDEAETLFHIHILHGGLRRIASATLQLSDVVKEDTGSSSPVVLEKSYAYEAGAEQPMLFMDVFARPVGRWDATHEL